MPVPPSRRSARWVAAIVAPLLLTPLALVPLGGAASGYAPAAVDARSAPVRSTNGWARLTDTSTEYVDQAVQPGLAQLADGTLVVAWRQTTSGSIDSSLATATVTPANVASSPTSQLTWPTLNVDPEVLALPAGAEVVFVGNDGTDGYFGQTNAYHLLLDEAGQETGPPPQERYFVSGVGADVPLDTARTPDGTTVVQQLRRWHEGMAAPSETEDPTYAPAPWSLSHTSIATAGATTYLGHFTTGVTGVVERGVRVGPLSAAADEVPNLLPGSWYADQPIALEGSTTGVLWAAYCTGTDACDRLVLRDVTNGRSLTVPSGEYAARVSLSPGPGGRMWVVWQSGSSAVSAARTNKAVTRFGPVRRSAPFYTVNSVRSVVVDGRTGPADVVLNGRGEVWHRRFLPPLTATASPTRWRTGRKQTVTVTVKDAGDAVPKALVALSGRTCTTGAAGTCSIVVPARASTATLTATVTRDGYEEASVSLRVVR